MKPSKFEVIIHYLPHSPFPFPEIIDVNSLVSALPYLAPNIWVPSKCIVLKLAF